MAWQGSILAPRAVITIAGGNINGVDRRRGDIRQHGRDAHAPAGAVPAGPGAVPAGAAEPDADADLDADRGAADADADPDRSADGDRTDPPRRRRRHRARCRRRRARRRRPERRRRPGRPHRFPQSSRRVRAPQPIVSPTATPGDPAAEPAAGPGGDTGQRRRQGRAERRARLQEGHDAARPGGRACDQARRRNGALPHPRDQPRHRRRRATWSSATCSRSELTLVRATVPIVYRSGRPCAVIPVLQRPAPGLRDRCASPAPRRGWSRTSRRSPAAPAARAHNTAEHPRPPRQGDRRRSDGLEVRAGAALSSSRRSRPSPRRRRRPAARDGRRSACPRGAVPPRRRARPRPSRRDVSAPTRASAWIARLVARTPAWDAPRAEGTPHMLEPLGRWTGRPGRAARARGARRVGARAAARPPERELGVGQGRPRAARAHPLARRDPPLRRGGSRCCATAARGAASARSSARPARPRQGDASRSTRRRASPTRTASSARSPCT